MTDMKKAWNLLKLLGFPLFAILLLILFSVMTESFADSHRTEQLRRIEDACRFAAVSCYAAEGVYPPDFAYLEENYGISVDESRYAVIYHAIAENLMPEITVVPLHE